jgi:hypothetical protein
MSRDDLDAHGAIVDWRPSPNRRRLVLIWTFRCLVTGALVAGIGIWSLHDRYTRIVLSGTGPAKLVQATHTHVEQPVEVSTPKEHIIAPNEHIVVKKVVKKPPAEWRPPLWIRGRLSEPSPL